MLNLTRKVDERIRIGNDPESYIWVSVTKKRSDGKLSIGIEAPEDIPVWREELIPDSGVIVNIRNQKGERHGESQKSEKEKSQKGQTHE